MSILLESEFFHDPTHKPIKYAVSHWSKEKYTQGGWSQLAVGGEFSHRRKLGEKITPNFVLAGEACSEFMSGMVNGAADTGQLAVHSICDENSFIEYFNNNNNNNDNYLVIIGAGAAGIFAAIKAKELYNKYINNENNNENEDCKIIIIEARDRIGGRIHTVDMSTPEDNNNTEDTKVMADLGATWMQQYNNNFVADIVKNNTNKENNLIAIPTDFSNALCTTNGGIKCKDMSKVWGKIEEYIDNVMHNNNNNNNNEEIPDRPLLEILTEYVNTITDKEEKFLTELAISIDVIGDLSYDLNDTSGKYAMKELGVGNDDHYLKYGYLSLLKHITKNIKIQLNTPITLVDYTNNNCIQLYTNNGNIITTNKCICTVPVGVIQNKIIQFKPELPLIHQNCLSKIKQGTVEKVLLRYNTRWWSGTNGIIRWYDTSNYSNNESHEFPLVLDYVEWLDMTDGIGIPIIMGFCNGKDAVNKFHIGTDEEIALRASLSFEKWAWQRLQDEKNERK